MFAYLYALVSQCCVQLVEVTNLSPFNKSPKPRGRIISWRVHMQPPTPVARKPLERRVSFCIKAAKAMQLLI